VLLGGGERHEHYRQVGSESASERSWQYTTGNPLLKKSAEIAEKEGKKSISDDHIDRAHEKLQYDNLVQKFMDQDDQKFYILKAVAHLTERGKMPARASTIHGVYEVVVYYCGDEPLTQRRMFTYRSKLVMFS